MPLNFIHLTDFHLSHPDLNDPHLHSDTVENLRMMVAKIQTISPPPSFVVASGDLTNQGDVASYQMLHDILKPLGMPIIYALGNHDKRAGFRTIFEPNTTLDAPYYHQTTQENLHIITLDSSVPNQVSGQISNEQFQFLETSLKAHPDLPKLLVIHHPPLITETSLPWESLNQSDSDRLTATLKGHNIVGMLSGHIHYNRVSQWHGIPVIISNGLHATVDPLRPSGMQIQQGIGFVSCTLRASGLTATFVPLPPEPVVLGEVSEDLLKSFR